MANLHQLLSVTSWENPAIPTASKVLSVLNQSCIVLEYMRWEKCETYEWGVGRALINSIIRHIGLYTKNEYLSPVTPPSEHFICILIPFHAQISITCITCRYIYLQRPLTMTIEYNKPWQKTVTHWYSICSLEFRPISDWRSPTRHARRNLWTLPKPPNSRQP